MIKNNTYSATIKFCEIYTHLDQEMKPIIKTGVSDTLAMLFDIDKNEVSKLYKKRINLKKVSIETLNIIKEKFYKFFLELQTISETVIEMEIMYIERMKFDEIGSVREIKFMISTIKNN